jgi:predicted ester cyclase
MIFGRRRPAEPAIGHDVLTSDEDRLGSVAAVDDDFVDVVGGSLDRQVTWRVPRSAIGRIEGETIRLTVSRGQAMAQGWERRTGAPAPTATPADEAPAATPADPSAVARRIVEEVLNRGNLDVVDELFAPDFRDHTPRPGQGPGREGYKQAITLLRSAFPDLAYTIEDLIAADDKVVLRLSARGTHQGDLMGIPPTGKPVRIVGIVIDRITDGKLVERWGLGDDLDLLDQLGVVTPPGRVGG